MRWMIILGMVGFSMGCPASEDKTEKAAEGVSIPPSLTKEAAEALKTPSIKLNPVETPLPGNVTPDFAHNRVADMSNTAAHTMRNVSIQVQGKSAEAALDSLAGQWAKAGFKAGNRDVDKKGTITQAFWSGGDGVGITQVVAAGGTHVTVIARNYKPEDKSTKEGFTSLLMITVNSK